MNDYQLLFTAALGLTPPWKVSKINFSAADRQLDIYIDFPSGSTFTCPVCGREGARAYDTTEKTWRHLNFFQHRTHLHARIPRVECGYGCGVKTVEVPWARPDSGFTLLFEAFIMVLAREMPVKAIAELVGEYDTRLWRILHHYVDQARAQQDFSDVNKVGVDETAAKRGHDYITLFMDLEKSRLLFATEGKGKETVDAFARDLKAHRGNPEAIKHVCCDLSPAFIAGVSQHLPNAELTFDRFHIMKIVNDALDEVRRIESQENSFLKKTRYLWLKNPEKLTSKQRERLESLKGHHLKTARAYQIRLSLRDFFEQQDKQAGTAFLKKWYFWATHSRLEPMIKAAKTIKSHWDGVLSWFDARVNNGILEGTNSLIQSAKSRARGYRSTKNLITISYIIAGKLDFGLPT